MNDLNFQTVVAKKVVQEVVLAKAQMEAHMTAMMKAQMVSLAAPVP